ncbi:hypothetical protein MHK_004581 [Candidatus Magnetomorum sp. HK-1]|nr:hypothetical protein MHK_004581 [Candidatus Magnetomorum sp. HK-1]
MNNPEVLSVCVNIDIATSSLQTVVQQCKKIVKPDKNGIYQVDPADVLSALVSRFLSEKHFDQYLENEKNYPIL